MVGRDVGGSRQIMPRRQLGIFRVRGQHVFAALHEALDRQRMAGRQVQDAGAVQETGQIVPVEVMARMHARSRAG